jgi:hypothetical protein
MYQSRRLRTNLRPPGFGSAGHFWNANRASEPGLFAKKCVPSGKWRKSTAFRHFGKDEGRMQNEEVLRLATIVWAGFFIHHSAFCLLWKALPGARTNFEPLNAK